MKICYSNPTVLMKRPVAQVAERVGKDHECSIYIPRKLGRTEKNRVKGVEITEYPSVSLSGESDFPIPDPFILFDGFSILKKKDIVHMWVPYYISNSLLAVLKLFFFNKKKLILTMDTIPGFSFKHTPFLDWFYSFYNKTLGKLVFAACDHIVLYGNSMKKYAKEAGIPMDKVTIIPTGIDPVVKKKSKDVRKEFGIGKNEKIVLFAGLMNNRKGIDTVIKIAKKLPSVKFVLIGEGPNGKDALYRKYKGMAKNLKNVVFTGFRKDVHNFYHEAAVFFLPSRGEGLAGVVMESMVYGVPVVSSRIPCTEDLIKDGESGFLCSIEDVAGYVKSIKKLLASKSLREKFAKKAKQKIKRDYSWDKNIKKLEKLYEEKIKQKN